MITAVFGPLVTPRQILDPELSGGLPYDGASMAALSEAARYISEFLTQTHPALGRRGAVCPFAGGGLQREAITLTASSQSRTNRESVISSIMGLAKAFSDDQDASGRVPDEIYRAVVVVFPHLPLAEASALVSSVQQEIKPFFVARGLMIGEFFPGCETGGLHNPEFRPLNTPFCSLAIRHMTTSDLPFMMSDDRYISHYLERFDIEGTRRLGSLIARRGLAPEQIAAIQQILGPVAVNN
ncbi:MAG: DUF6875 domain-containing protein [Janthinobacterium lividum]